MSLRWGVAVESPVTKQHSVIVYQDEAEARHNARPFDTLVVDDGNGWMITE